MSSMRRAAAVIAALLLLVPGGRAAAEFGGASGVLPAGTELGEEALARPRELFHSEAIQGRKSYLINLGDMAFSAPSILGGPARQAGMSCSTCHINGAGNARFFLPGASTRPGTFDTTGALFNPKADNGFADAVTIPSLRGARFLAPYGHDGRTASLRDFIRTVIVTEFAGAEPAPEILDGLVAYIQDIDFMPNRRLGLDGTLVHPNDAEKRGAALFVKPFAHDPNLSCASCHMPSAGFVDHQQHEVGSAGLFKTPTLLNANFNAPYFHDGRYASYDEVIVHFDRVFYLGLSAQDRSDLAAYLRAIGDGEEPSVLADVDQNVTEITDFLSVLDTAIPAHDGAVVALTVDTVAGELRELTEKYPERKDASVTGGRAERVAARAALKELVLLLRQVGDSGQAGKFDQAAADFSAFRTHLAAAIPLLKAAEPWSLFNPSTHDAHFAAVRQLYRSAVDPVVAARRPYDFD
jgi:cytochrome c peroxidase